MKKKISTGRKSSSTKDLGCKECGNIVYNVDTDTESVLCWRCVLKSLNPSSTIVSDMTAAEFGEFLKKQRNK